MNINIYLLISGFVFALGSMLSMQRQIQMFQQNSYYVSRYFKWFKGNIGSKAVISLVFFAVSVFLSFTEVSYLLIALSLIGSYIRFKLCISNQKKSIKKLVYTNRIKRLIATASVIFVLLTAAGGIFTIPYPICFTLLLIFSYFPATLMLLANLVNKPMEKTINNGFVKDAKRILKNNKNLLTIGVTGSFGKTSVKFILTRILSEKYNTVCTPESFNTPMGVVRTVRQSIKPQTEIFIAEMGAKNRYDIKELCQLANPTLGVITAVGAQHLETFGSVENVAKTKFELADHCKGKSGKVYVNFDSDAAKKYATDNFDSSTVISVGTGNTDCRAENIHFSKAGTEFEVVYKDFPKFTLSCKLLGKHSITNILLAVSVALDLGLTEKEIRFAVASLKAPPHRLEMKPFTAGSLLIDDAYNSNPEGCLEAVRVLGSFKGMRRVLVTPGLVELGDKEYECNFNLGTAAANQADDIILVGKKRAIPMKDAIDKTDFDKSRVYIAESFKDAMTYFNKFADSNTVVLFENDLPDNYAG